MSDNYSKSCYDCINISVTPHNYALDMSDVAISGLSEYRRRQFKIPRHVYIFMPPSILNSSFALLEMIGLKGHVPDYSLHARDFQPVRRGTLVCCVGAIGVPQESGPQQWKITKKVLPRGRIILLL